MSHTGKIEALPTLGDDMPRLSNCYGCLRELSSSPVADVMARPRPKPPGAGAELAGEVRAPIPSSSPKLGGLYIGRVVRRTSHGVAMSTTHYVFLSDGRVYNGLPPWAGVFRFLDSVRG